MSRELDEALIAAPEGTEVELRYGALCVSAPNAITQAAALDALCRLAAAVAAGVARAAALLPSLDAAEPLPRRPSRRARSGSTRASRAGTPRGAACGSRTATRFRRRFDSPVPGEPLKVMFGPIAAGVPAGRLVLWLDKLDLAVKRYFVLAVVPGPHGPEVVSREVTDAERSAATLDALAAEAALRHADTPLISR